MKSDINGCSTCEAGQEQYEEFFSTTINRNMVQYDYRTEDGENLFSCVRMTLEMCRKAKTEWLKKNNFR
jgi:hypothetical protein